jgi:CHAD domain-containing protein
MALEEERKYEAAPSFVVPELTGCVAGGEVVIREPVTLTAIYYDTDDLRLARAGVSLRHRRGDPEPWTVKLPSDTAGIRHEISRRGRPGEPPAELVDLVTSFTRGETVRPVTTVRTRRRRYELMSADARPLAEVADDTVEVLDGRRVVETFREIEVERLDGDGLLLDRVGERLVGASATEGGFVPKHVRALGPAATEPPDLPAPAPLGPDPAAGEVVTAAVRRSVARIISHDPALRLDEELPGGDTAVHQMRVGCRRLRSDLRTFGPLVDAGWARDLRREVRWLARTLGGARDAEVLRERLRDTAAADPLAPLDQDAVARVDAALVHRRQQAANELSSALGSGRYRSLLEALVRAAASPRLTTLADQPARGLLPRLVARPWRTLVYGASGVDGAADLAADANDAQWHRVRVNAKQARYAVEAVAGVVGGGAPKLARRLSTLQDLLGAHQDAAVAADTWLTIAASDPDDHTLAVTAGRLHERERAAIRDIRDRFPAVWRRASKRRLVAWLP